MSALPKLPALLLAFLVLTGCDSKQEKAEAHYQNSMELLQSGDEERAMVELRNVFRLDGNHNAARLVYADLLRERGEIREAWSQYLRLVEQDPDNLEGRLRLTELALAAHDTATARPHADRAFSVAPQDPRVRALRATLDYADGDHTKAVEMAGEVLEEDPAQIPAHMVLIADRVRDGDREGALELTDRALEQAPEDLGLHLLRLGMLEALGDEEETGAQLTRMARLFPDNDSVTEALVRWHLTREDPDSAEAVLRAAASRDPENEEALMRVVSFLATVHGPDAAAAELARLAETEADPAHWQRTAAWLDFSRGRRQEAIAALRPLAEAGEATESRRESRIMLARILGADGDSAGRDALVDTVLEEDSTHVEALKLRARRHIDTDRPELAIQDLRNALGQAPRDAAALTLMAEAHEREGAHELAGERLALAVDASDQGAAETIRYARFLLADGRTGPAESIVTDALRLDRQNPDLLQILAELHLAREDWQRAGQTADLLRATGRPDAARSADRIAAQALAGEGRHEETIALLQEMAEADDSDMAALAALLRGRVAQGKTAEAQEYVAGRLAADPGSEPLRLIAAELQLAAGDMAAAEAGYREILEADPDSVRAAQRLVTLLAGSGRTDEAEAVLDGSISATQDGGLMFTKASMLEQRGDVDGAIELYETLYARNSASDLVANNLASLITTHRSDDESLERAFSIARRLRSSGEPWYQDTYGWILYRRGDAAQALDYLQPAAEKLPDNALVQYHLGMTLAALDRPGEARTALEAAVELAGPGNPLPGIEEIRAQAAAMPEEPAAEE